MRILLVAPQPFYQERGTPIAVRMLAEALCGQGHAVDLLTYHEGADLDIDGLKILRTPALPGLRHVPIGISWKKLVCDLLISGRLLGLALSHRYDVIHAVEEAVFPAILLRSSARARVVYDMDSLLGESLVSKWRLLWPAQRLLRAMERAVIRRADAVFAVCKDLARHATVDAPGVPVFLIEDVALPAQQYCGEAEPLRELLDVRGPLALYVGNLQRYQGVEQVVSAMAQLPKSFDITLVLIGGAPEDVARVRSLVHKLHLEERIYLLGPRPLAHLTGFLTQADILVSPRLYGSNTPMKIYSYMGSGTAILATRIASHTQVLDDDSALLVEPTPQALAKGLATLAADEPLRARLGAAARRRAGERYSLEAFREKVRAAYQTLETRGAA
ncbi:MAG: glycosyltransferase family 4 protein [Gammaproteobacteria bacterium]|nr:glycosyltransferase family 4 protein [Gammaproteobacteria bacterium]